MYILWKLLKSSFWIRWGSGDPVGIPSAYQNRFKIIVFEYNILKFAIFGYKNIEIVDNIMLSLSFRKKWNWNFQKNIVNCRFQKPGFKSYKIYISFLQILITWKQTYCESKELYRISTLSIERMLFYNIKSKISNQRFRV